MPVSVLGKQLGVQFAACISLSVYCLVFNTQISYLTKSLVVCHQHGTQLSENSLSLLD